MTLNPELLKTTSLIGYLLVIQGGVVTSIGPCNMATIPFCPSRQAKLPGQLFWDL